MKKILKVLKYIVILFVCIVLLVSSIATGIILAKDLEERSDNQCGTQNIFSTRSVNYYTTETEIPDAENILINNILGNWQFASTISRMPGSYYFEFSALENNFTGIRFSTDTIYFINSSQDEAVYDISSNTWICTPSIAPQVNITSISASSDTETIYIWLSNNALKISESDYDTGYEAGFSDGQAAGEQIGYEQGYDEGVSDGFYNGYNDGFEEGKTTSYDDGYNDALDLARSNIFSSATLIKAYPEENTNYTFTNPIIKLPNGISFKSIANAADEYFVENSIVNLSFIVEFQFEPFLFEENQIYTSISYGFSGLIFYDTSGNSYSMEWDGNKTDIGYAVSAKDSTAIQDKKICRAKITFTSPDYTGDLITPDYLSYQDYYDRGYDEGYKNGYDIGLGQTVGSLTGWDAIKNAFTSIFETLQIKVFGLFSLGDVIMICLVFAVVLFFLKVIRG